MRIAILFATIPLLLAACDALQPDRTALTSSAVGGVVERPRCNACHEYAPRTGAHRYHLDTLRQGSTSPLITCATCHAASIATHIVSDTAYRFVDPSDHSDTAKTMTYHTAAGWPWKPFKLAMADSLIFDTTVTDTVTVPLLWQPRGAGDEQPQWVTRTAAGPGLPGHANGAKDVVFAPGLDYEEILDDGSRVPHKAAWSLARLSCNAVKCHKDPMNEAHYTWKEPAGTVK